MFLQEHSLTEQEPLRDPEYSFGDLLRGRARLPWSQGLSSESEE
jgi:hypothetical protein